MLTIVCYKWAPHRAAKTVFTGETVNVLRAMVERHYATPHRFVCVTDDSTGIDRDIETVPLWSDFADLPSPHGGKNPSCYRRLRMFSREISELFGPRFIALDLDCVITGDVSTLFDRAEDFIIWGDTNPRTHYNGSMMLMTAGARAQVWERFDPKTSPQKALQAGCFGSDQGWISYCLGPGEAKWSKTDGVFSFRNHLKPTTHQLPSTARIVFFHGSDKPWTPGMIARYPWIGQHYQAARAVCA